MGNDKQQSAEPNLKAICVPCGPSPDGLNSVQTHLLRDEVGIVDIFLQLQQDLGLNVGFVVFHQAPQEGGVP